MKRKKMMTQKEINDLIEEYQQKDADKTMKEELNSKGKEYHKDEFDAFRGRKA